MESFSTLLAIVVFIAFIWFMYCNITIFVVYFMNRKKDKTLSLCLNAICKIFYIVLFVVFIAQLLLGFLFIGKFIIAGDFNSGYIVLNIMTVLTIGITFLFQQIIWIGKRDIMIGRLTLDKRKIKRIKFYRKNLQFVYGQKNYKVPLRFIDDQTLKISLQRR